MVARDTTAVPAARADPAAGRRASARLAAPPMLAWLAANAFYWAAADRAGFDWFLVRTHARWDSGNYLSVTRHGYTLAHCLAGLFYQYVLI